MNTASPALADDGSGPRARRLSDDDGQSLVEAAFVLPAMTVLVLMMLQLTMIQHAKIMTEYAAFCAARAGIVFNADRPAMEQAAQTALLPTLGRTDTLTRFTQMAVIGVNAEKLRRAPYAIPIVRITTLSPLRADFGSLGRHLGGREIDFDDIRTAAARPNQLQIELKYFYRMSIPFANSMLQSIFFANTSNTLQFWGRNDPDMTRPTVFGGDATLAARAGYIGVGGADAARIVAAAYGKHYFFPLKATYTMRMQSNAFIGNTTPPPPPQ